MTDDDAIIKRFDALSVWQQGDQRAPHKPLLVLYALGRWQRGLAEVTFREAEAEPELAALLREFGPPRRSDHPEHGSARDSWPGLDYAFDIRRMHNAGKAPPCGGFS